MQGFGDGALFGLLLSYIVVEGWFGNAHHLTNFTDGVLTIVVEFDC
jgi:hypothetical protein